MRNLKRALSLGLTATMISGLMVMGSSAASYADVTSEQNQEAIEVLKAVDIMVGDEKGNFNPEAKVTRNEMAVVMSNLMAYNVKTYKDTSPFTDVPEWAEPYVAACYTNGITSGYTANTYGGSDNVTTAQAALMVMKALGYFQFQSDFGSDWQLSTVAQGNKIDLFDDVDSGVKDAMTRNDLAQLVLNALKSGTVEADDDTIKVNTDGVTVEAGKVNYNYITSNKDYAEAISDKAPTSSTSSTVGAIVELGEKLYDGDLKLNDDTTDDFGAPANRWTYKNVEIGTYAEKADYTFAGVVKSNAMYDAVGKTAARDYRWDVLMDGTTTPVKADGTEQALFTQKDVEDNDKEDLDGTVRGSNTYVYLDDEATKGYAGTATVVIINTYAAEVTKVNDGTITLDDMDKSGLEFDVEGYSEDDVVLYTKSLNGNTWTVQNVLGKAELVEGEAGTIRENDRVEMDGTTYKYSYRFNDDNGDKLTVDSVDENVAFYLDQQGNIIRMEDASESNDYAYVYSIGDASNKYGDDAEFGAKLILADGTVMKIDIDSDTTDDLIANYGKAKSEETNLDKVKAELLNQVVSYSEESDGSYSLSIRTNKEKDFDTAVEDVVKSGTSRVKLADGSYIYADKNTAFVINEESDDADDFTAYVGYENVPDVDSTTNSELVAFVNSKGIAKVIFITNAEVSGSAKDVIFVVGNKSAKLNGTGSNEYRVYDAVVKGEAVSIKVKETSKAATEIAKIGTDEVGIFFGITENSDGYVTQLTTKLPSDVVVNGEYTGTQRESAGGNLGFAIDAKGEYTVHYAGAEDAIIAYYDDHDLTVESRVKTDANDKAYVVTDDGEVIAIYVHEVEDGTDDGKVDFDDSVQSVSLTKDGLVTLKLNGSVSKATTYDYTVYNNSKEVMLEDSITVKAGKSSASLVLEGLTAGTSYYVEIGGKTSKTVIYKESEGTPEPNVADVTEAQPKNREAVKTLHSSLNENYSEVYQIISTGLEQEISGNTIKISGTVNTKINKGNFAQYKAALAQWACVENNDSFTWDSFVNARNNESTQNITDDTEFGWVTIVCNGRVLNSCVVNVNGQANVLKTSGTENTATVLKTWKPTGFTNVVEIDFSGLKF